jgi:putative glutamine amidotransferase
MTAPLHILIPCSYTPFNIPGSGPLYYQVVFEPYVNAVTAHLQATPLLLPTLPDETERIRACLQRVDGVLLTGDVSNIDPALYGGQPQDGPQDPQRDRTVIPLIQMAIEMGVPLLGICRGHQELNVALGGTLHQRLHELPSRQDHRAQRDRPFPDRHLPAHKIQVQPGGWLEAVLDRHGIPTDPLWVNSLHGQGVDRLGQSLVVEATAEDGTVEAMRLDGPALTLGIQWHLEWYTDKTPLYAALFAEFRQACLAYQAAREA